MESRILLVGATGLVGQGVLEVLLRETRSWQVTALVRRPLSAASPRIRIMQIPDFSADALAGVDLGGFDVCLYCAGPLPLLLSEAAYREATVGMLERVSMAFAHANPKGYLIYVSGAGANPDSRWMPLRVKGQAEGELGRIGVAHTCLRPGGIRPTQGERSRHLLRRYMYMLAAPALALAVKAMPGVFTTTDAVGRCMLTLVRSGPPYPSALENRHINQIASASRRRCCGRP